jgi:virginiamycin A acetyltransferase
MFSMLKSLQDKWFLRKHLSQQLTSEPLRCFFKEHYSIVVGLHSYGCFDVSRIPRGTKIGRYCSFANSAVIFNGNHGLDFLSLHPYFYNVQLGCVNHETITRNNCTVEDDVWIGHSAIILPNVRLIGRGAVVGAGAVVTRNVPRYAIVAGNPAKIVRYRFSESVIESIEATEWWNMSLVELKGFIKDQSNMVFRPSDYFAGNCD